MRKFNLKVAAAVTAVSAVVALLAWTLWSGVAAFILFLIGAVILAPLGGVVFAKRLRPAAAAPARVRSHSHLNFAEYREGHGLRWLILKRLSWFWVPALGLIGWGMMIDSFWPWFAGFLILGGLMPLYIKYGITSIGEYSQAIKARLNKITEEILGPGLHDLWRFFGEEKHEVPTNHFNITIKATRQTKNIGRGSRVLTLEVQLTGTPYLLIADEHGISNFGHWYLHGVHQGPEIDPEAYAQQRVREAAERDLKGLLLRAIETHTDEQLDAFGDGISLFIESEASLRTPLHRDPALRREIVGFDTPEPADPLEWYQMHHRAIREYLDDLQGNVANRLHQQQISRTEAHVGVMFSHGNAIDKAYDVETTEADKKPYAAERTRQAKVIEGQAVDELVVRYRKPAKAGGPGMTREEAVTTAKQQLGLVETEQFVVTRDATTKGVKAPPMDIVDAAILNARLRNLRGGRGGGKNKGPKSPPPAGGK